jgi:uncharacterized repeat protein (TIGR03803 family)
MKRAIIVLAVALVSVSQLPGQAKLKILHNFGSGTDGNVPAGPLSLDAHGNLYGITRGGPGQYGYGVAFQLTPQKKGGWGEKVIQTFAGGNGGSAPWGGLTLAASGTLYGTLQGSSADIGAVFSLSRGTSGWNYNILYTAGTDRPDGPGVALDSLGNLYGEIGDGQNSLGALGELSPGSDAWNYTQLYNFCPQYCPDGWGPPAPPIWDKSGNLWGATTYGGITQTPCFTTEGCGVIYEMTPNGDGTRTYSAIHQFASSSTDGQEPYGGLVMDASGNFYGSTWLGGAYNQGTIFKLSNVDGTWQETILYDFPSCPQGCMVEGTLARDKAGNLYGTAAGGKNSCAGYACGVIFKLAPQSNGTWKYTVLYNFSETSGGLQPFYGVILDSKGNLYGVTSSFGKYNEGTAFELTP